MKIFRQKKFIPFFIFVLALAVWSVVIKPQIESTARKEILKFLNERPEIKAHFKEFNFNLLLGKASVDHLDIEIIAPEIRQYINAVKMDSLQVHLDLFKLVIGQFAISYISLDKAQLTLALDPLIDAPASAPSVIPTEKFFKILGSVPLGAIELNSTHLILSSPKYKFSIDLPGIDAVVSKRKNQIDFQTKIEDVTVETESVKSPPSALALHASMTPEQAEIKTFNIQSPFIQTTASGKFLNIKNLLFFPKSIVDLQSQIDFDALSKNLPQLSAFDQIRKMKGVLSIQAQASFIEKNRIQGKFDLGGKGLGFDSYKIGDLKALGQLKNDRAEISQVQLTQPAGQINLSKISLQLDQPFTYKATVNAKDLVLEKLFQALNLNKIPVFATIQGDLQCSGQVTEFLLSCEAQAQIQNFEVSDGPQATSSSIVAVPEGNVTGNFKLKKNFFEYKGKLRVGNSSADSSGGIDFDHGFEIDVVSDKTVLQDLGLISKLSLLGDAQLKSSIKGNAETAVFQIQADIKNFEFEKYKFGDLVGTISYEKGQMFFQNLRCKKTASDYAGDLKIHFLKKTISGQVSFPTAELSDIQDLISQNLQMPADFRGKGQLEIRFDGPLDLWKMDTYAKGQFQDIFIADESFERLDLLTQGTQGTISIEKFALSKKQGQIIGSGKILSTQEYQIAVEGSQLKLEESTLVSKINSNIFGTVGFSTKVTGRIDNPLVDLRGSITDTVMDDQELLPSRFSLTLDRDRFLTNFELFGQKVIGEFQIPMTQNVNNPLKIKLKMNRWAYGDLFAVFGNPLLLSDYRTLITGQIDLVTSPQQKQMNYAQTDGVISIEKFLLRRGNQQLANEKPLVVELNSGAVKIKHFELKSKEQDYLLLPSQQFTLNQFDLNFQSELNLHLFHIFLPFLEDLGGQIRLRGKIAGNYMKPEVYGDASVSSGFVKLKGLVHPVENIESKIEFSQSKMMIQSLKALFAQGTVHGSGFAQIVNTAKSTDGPEKSRALLIPLQMSLTVTDMKLNVPDQVHTQGNATLTVSGENIPYILRGQYVIKSGLVERDFSQSEETGQIQRNYYLPQQIFRKELDPLNFDILVMMDQGIVVKNSNMEGGIKGRLNLKGTPQAPLLFGKINFDKNSMIIFRDKSFSLQSGVLDFNNPNEISPDMYITANTRIAEYDVNLIAQGEAKDLNIQMTSVPPLSDPDLISLLALGVTSTKLEAQGSSSSQAQQTGYELGSAIFSQNPLNQKIKKRLDVNLQLSSSFDSTKNIVIPKITATRKLSEKVSASMSRTVGTEETTAEVKLQYLINQNVSAIGSFENKEEGTETGISAGENEQKSILGLDLEYKREFK
ncbi:MAG: translocation/assembly module TamB domain-containing protein [Pseudobdellovibrionaceae bacterium]